MGNVRFRQAKKAYQGVGSIAKFNEVVIPVEGSVGRDVLTERLDSLPDGRPRV